MDRRASLLALFAMPMGFFVAYRKTAAAELGTGTLRIPLDQWGGLVVEHGGKTITLSPREIFDALKENT